MADPRQVHRVSTRVMSALMVVLGVALVVVTLANGGGPLALGFFMGLLFVAAGAARLYLEREQR